MNVVVRVFSLGAGTQASSKVGLPVGEPWLVRLLKRSQLTN
jgi:hypothetical protein